MHYRFTDGELKTLTAGLTVLTDTREQANEHITAWLSAHGVQHRRRALPTGDYGIMLAACSALGLHRDIYFDAAVERKASVDELVASVKDRSRFENELIRGSRLGFFAILVEDAAGFARMAAGDYRGAYHPKALLASLASFSVRHRTAFVFVDQAASARWIWLHLHYAALEALRTGEGRGHVQAG